MVAVRCAADEHRSGFLKHSETFPSFIQVKQDEMGETFNLEETTVPQFSLNRLVGTFTATPQASSRYNYGRKPDL